MIKAGTLQSLQALRGVGAVAVVIYHALSIHPFLNFRAGAAGVDLFFVISGIVMCLSLRPETTALDFMKRRVIRVVPMYWIATTLAAAYFYIRYPDIPPSTIHIVRSYLFAPPPEGFGMPVLYPGWTLNFEMFFYAVLSVMLVTRRMAIPLAACLLVVLSSVGSVIPSLSKIYYFNPIILEFAAGMVIGLAIKAGYRPRLMEGSVYLIGALVLIVVHNHYRSEGVLPWLLPSILLIVGSLAFETSKVVTHRFTQLIGEASYSIYLFHALAIWLTTWIWRGTPQAGAVLFAIALSVVMGVAAHYTLEKPLLNLMLRRRKSSAKKSLEGHA
ncbi:acyltransferase family protein [Stenotrophomonas maltophilia]|uniref:acyltransferase family protein n=1 Tax=Stenotrophomonas maltophilia TaxID=40324 RepID=UPI0039C1A428